MEKATLGFAALLLFSSCFSVARGALSDENQFPFMVLMNCHFSINISSDDCQLFFLLKVSIQARSLRNGGLGFCSGVIIAEEYVVTTASCCNGQGLKLLKLCFFTSKL